MDEHQYKTTYHSINPHRCVFEKALNSRICNCSMAQRFNLADREGVACTSVNKLQRCDRLLTEFRKKAKFALQRMEASQILAHTEEIKIQNGGMLGLQEHVEKHPLQTVQDIASLIDRAERQFNGMDRFPYSQLMQGITAYQIRNRRHKSRIKK